MKIKSLPLVALLAACMLAACQSTPSEAPVVRKDQSNLYKATGQPASAAPGGAAQAPVTVAAQVAAPANYTAELTGADGKLRVTANADVIVPDAAAMPVLRVAAADFTQEQVDGLIRALLPGKTLYEIVHGRLSKSEIGEQILQYKRMKTQDEFKSEGDQAKLDESIKRLQEARKDAPEKSERQVRQSDGKLSRLERFDSLGRHLYYYTGVSLTTDAEGKKSFSTFAVENNNDMNEAEVSKNSSGEVTSIRLLSRNAMIRYTYNQDIHTPLNLTLDAPVPVYEAAGITDTHLKSLIKMTPGEARKRGEEFLKAASVGTMAVRSLELVSDCYDSEARPVKPTRCAYRVLFTRIAGGLPCSYIEGSTGDISQDKLMKSGGDSGELKFAASWHYETMTLLLDDTGILGFTWSSPLTVTDTVQAQAGLLGFDEIRQRFEKQMQYMLEPQAKEKGVTGIDVDVVSVRLELQRVIERDSIGNGLLVPVWNFYGTQTVQNANNPEAQAVTGILVTVNAIDGSIIDRELGY